MERVLHALDKLIIAALFVFVFFSMFSISVTQIACGLGGLAWLFRTYLAHSIEKQHWPLGIPFAAYALACLVAVGSAYDISYSFGSLKKLLEILIFFWVVNCVREDHLRNSLALLLIIAALIAAFIGFYQVWKSGITVLDRIEGTMSVYMTFAGLLMMVGMVAFARVMFKQPREKWLLGAALVIAVCLLCTLTRQAWFGFLAGFLFLSFVSKWKYFLISLALILVISFSTSGQIKTHFQSLFPLNGKDQVQYGYQKDDTFVDQIKYRIYGMISGNDYNFGVRLALWKGGWEIFKDYPLTGCGFRCVDIVNHQYPDPTGFVKRYRGMHNNFVQLAVDTGVLGLTAWLGIWVCFFRLLYQRATVLKIEPGSRWIILGSAAAGIAFLAGGFFETNFYDSEVVMVLYLIMALPFCGSQNLVSKLRY